MGIGMFVIDVNNTDISGYLIHACKPSLPLLSFFYVTCQLFISGIAGKLKVPSLAYLGKKVFKYRYSSMHSHYSDSKHCGSLLSSTAVGKEKGTPGRS